MEKMIRWTINRAASEFPIDRRTLSKRLRQARILPGKDGKFSTVDIYKAIYTDYEKERLRKVTEEADALALANQATRERLVDKADLLRRFEPLFERMRALILTSPLTEKEKEDILHLLAGLKDS